MNIIDALKSLDVENDDHWNSDKSPRLPVVKSLVGGDVSRSDIVNTAKSFSRDNPVFETEEENAVIEKIENKEEKSDDKEIEKELRDSRTNLDAAKTRFDKAQRAMDVVISRNAVVQNNQSNAEAIKKFQQSQSKQRQKQKDDLFNILKANADGKGKV